MTDVYTMQERIAIKQDSHIDERQAIAQAKRELSAPECVEKFQALRERKKLDDAEKHFKRARKFADD